MKESLIRGKCQEVLRKDGWVMCTPKRGRNGSSITETLDGVKKGSEDIFTIFDIVAWKEDILRFIQYTSASNISARVKKIKDFIRENNLVLPEGVYIEVWGYTDRKGFTHHRLRETFL